MQNLLCIVACEHCDVKEAQATLMSAGRGAEGSKQGAAGESDCTGAGAPCKACAMPGWATPATHPHHAHVTLMDVPLTGGQLAPAQLARQHLADAHSRAKQPSKLCSACPHSQGWRKASQGGEVRRQEGEWLGMKLSSSSEGHMMKKESSTDRGCEVWDQGSAYNCCIMMKPPRKSLFK